MHAIVTVPVAISNAANSMEVPCRTYSCVRRAGSPGCIGSIGAVRSSALIGDFVRHEALQYRREVEGLHRWAVAAAW